jgi:hypothetical protein
MQNSLSIERNTKRQLEPCNKQDKKALKKSERFLISNKPIIPIVKKQIFNHRPTAVTTARKQTIHKPIILEDHPNSKKRNIVSSSRNNSKIILIS